MTPQETVVTKIRDTIAMAILAMGMAVAWMGIMIGSKNIDRLVDSLLQERNELKKMLGL